MCHAGPKQQVHFGCDIEFMLIYRRTEQLKESCLLINLVML